MPEWWNFSCLSILNLTAAGSSFFWISEFQENFWRIELTRCAETRLKMRAVCIQAKGHLCSLGSLRSMLVAKAFPHRQS